MPRPVHFEIHASDPARLAQFYETMFGWSIQRWGEMPYWMVATGTDGPGIDGGLLPRQGPGPAAGAPVNGFVVTVDVPDVDEYTARAEREGATIALPKMAVPGVGWLVYILDPDANIVGMLQADDAAA